MKKDIQQYTCDICKSLLVLRDDVDRELLCGWSELTFTTTYGNFLGDYSHFCKKCTNKVSDCILELAKKAT